MIASDKPKITVVVPTRARPDVLLHCLRTISNQDYDKLEILVSDNLSNDDTADVVRSLSDPRLKYLNTGKRLSMSHNWEFALSHVEGGWVTIVGDDDGLMPNALEATAQIVVATGTKAVRSAVCQYRWPAPDGTVESRLKIPTRQGLEVRNSFQWLQRAMSGYASYADLPMLYTGGFVQMDVMNEIKARTGAYYKSCVPDVYSGVAIASVVPSYTYSYAPLALSGVSRHSTGTAHFSQPKTDSATSPVQQFLREDNIPFHPAIPVCENGNIPRSSQITLLESYLQSARLREEPQGDFFGSQLQVIAATSDSSDSDLLKWMEDFSRMHRLEGTISGKLSSLKRLARQLSGAPERTLRRIRTAKLTSRDCSIENVYQASLAAQTRLAS